jgi:glutathione synthase/RimK-type ligase-like ATP-grasp enzyme
MCLSSSRTTQNTSLITPHSVGRMFTECPTRNGPNQNSGRELCIIRECGPTGHILRAVHTSNSPALHKPGGFPGLATKAELTMVLLVMCIPVPETCVVTKPAFLSHLVSLYLTYYLRCTVTQRSNSLP